MANINAEAVLDKILQHKNIEKGGKNTLGRNAAIQVIYDYRKDGNYFTPDEIRRIQEIAYEAGYNAGQD